MSRVFPVPAFASILALLAAVSCGRADGDTIDGLTAAQAAAVREHAAAIEHDLATIPWCGTGRLYHARQIHGYGPAGWDLAEASMEDPEVARSLRESIERADSNSEFKAPNPPTSGNPDHR